MPTHLLTPAHEVAYGEYVDAHPHGSFFHSRRYLKLLEQFLDATPHTLIEMDDAGAITGVLPGFIAEGPHGLVYNSLPFYGSHGSLLINNEADFATWQSTLDALGAAKSITAATFVSPHTYSQVEADAWQQVVGPTHRDERIGQITPLAEIAERDPEPLFQLFHSKTRNAVRKGYRLEAILGTEDSDAAWQSLVQTHADNLAEIGGKAKPAAFFNLVREGFRPAEEYQLFTARIDHERVAALLLFYYRDTVEYFTPVVTAEARSSQVLSALIHHAMADAATKGYRRWNWGGTWKSQEGVYRFKSRWGAEDHQYAYLTKVLDTTLLQIAPTELAQHYPYFYLFPY